MYTILLIEDEYIISKDVKTTLEKDAFAEVVIVRDFEAANKVFTTQDFDLIISDINLNQDIDGIEIISRLSTHKTVPVVYLTAYSDEVMIERAKQTMPFAYLLKPYNENQLKVTLSLAMLNYTKQTENAEVNAEHTALLDKLTKREKQVLVVLSTGKQTKEIADSLNISAQTVEKHKQNIKEKLNLRTVGELIHFTMTSNLFKVS